MTLFDAHAEAVAAKQAAIEQVDGHTDPDWHDAAYRAVRALAAARVPFTADDVWDHPELEGFSTHEPAALGPVFLRASKRKLIRKTGRAPMTRHRRRHRDLTEWVGV